MDSAGVLFAKFVGATVCGAAIGMLIYWLMDRKPWPITARLAGGVSGAALGIVSIGVVWLSAALPAQAAESPTWRGSVTSERARLIAGELFPDKCGNAGLACGITYDDRRKCPFEFVVQFPHANKGEPQIAYVTLDKNGGVIGVSSVKKGTCASAKS